MADEKGGGVMTIDARGLECPKPVILAEETLSKIGEGIVEVIVDNEASAKNLAKFASTSGYYSETVQDDNLWRVKIIKGYPCEVPGEKKEQKRAEKDLLLIVGSDTLGKEEDLGRILMKGYFETMKVYGQIPHMIFFLNAGVKLTTLNKEIIPVLKDLEAMGVEIFSCGTCLKYYNLESELKVGRRGTTNHIVEGMQDFKKTVWIG